jgi:hypothetical protein
MELVKRYKIFSSTAAYNETWNRDGARFKRDGGGQTFHKINFTTKQH